MRFVNKLRENCVPRYFHSIIHRIYFVNKTPVTSLEEVVAQLETVYAKSPPSEDLVLRKKKLFAFPRELETKIKTRTLGQEYVESVLKKAKSKDEPALRNKDNCPGDDTENPSSAGAAAVKINSSVPKPPTALGQLQAAKAENELFDCVIYADGFYWVGLDIPKCVVPEKPRKSVPSGAYWKLFEIEDRYISTRDMSKPRNRELRNFMKLDDATGADHGEADHERMAIDIGASPGGWSYCLSKDFGLPKVLAVDPGKHMHPLVVERIALKKIDQWVMKGDKALEKLAEMQGDKANISVFVCDMNDEMENPVALLEYVHAKKLYSTADPCLVVLTFKNTCKSKADFDRRKAVCIERMEKICDEVEEIHLFANTKMETTVVGQIWK